MALRLGSFKYLNPSYKSISRPRILPLKPSPTTIQRTYARYSRFEDERSNKTDGPDDPKHNNFGRSFELFRLYGSGAAVVGVGVVWYVTHLEQVPETKRWRYMDASQSMRQSLEKQSYTQLMSEFGDSILPMNHRATKWVQGVAERLIDKNGLGHVVTRAVTSKEDQKPEEWLVYVVNQDIKNAFVMPGRKIVVFSGMLGQVKDEDQLAGILAHEVAHQLVGHVLERVSLTRLLFFVDVGIQFILGVHTNLSGVVLEALIGLPHSRTQELEADLVGLRLMSKACFDPDAVVSFWKSFEKEDKQQPPQFLSTHPGHRQRAKAIEGWIPAVRAEFPCIEMVDFTHAYQQQTVRDKPSGAVQDLPSPPVRKTGTTSRPAPPSKPAPSPSSSPDGSDWGANDPWATGSSGSSAGSGDGSNWGTKDPWAEKNGGANKGSSW